jgi:hypothetical protein
VVEDERYGAFLDLAGVPRPDGTPVGDAKHLLAVMAGLPDDYCLLVATREAYAPSEDTGLSVGDLRRLVSLAELGLEVSRLVDKHSNR